MTPTGSPELAWTAWPFRRRPARGALAAILVAGTCYGVWDLTRDAWIATLSLAILSVAVGPFFVPTAYRLSQAGVEIRRPWRTSRRGWGSFRGVRSNRDLVVLSPFRKGSWLDGIRGEALFFEGNRGEVLDYVERMVGSARADAG